MKTRNAVTLCLHFCFITIGHKKAAKETASPTFLKPNSKDTPRRTSPVQSDTSHASSRSKSHNSSSSSTPDKSGLGSFFSNCTSTENPDPFPSSSFGGTNFFASHGDDESTSSKNPFFYSPGSNNNNTAAANKETSFDPRNYKTEPTR